MTVRALRRPARQGRRGLAAWAVITALCALLIGCATPPQPWESRLSGNTLALLGEVHDNAAQHRLRLDLLRRALGRGWRPAIAMEQFDIGRQRDIERARRERPHDARYLIERATATTPGGKPGAGWDWAFYEPYVALALAYDLPLLAANLPEADTRRIVHEGTAAVFDPARRAVLGLDRPIAADWERAQEAEIESGHCGALPASLLPRMARAQFARDAVMAEVLRRHGAQGIVLLAGNGHVRRDLGVPRWLADLGPRLFTLGLLEADNDETPPAAFDATLRTADAAREDPCAGFDPARLERQGVNHAPAPSPAR
ncbi:MAG: ChaN family lipoprotein [Burkholderiales bacterium]|nr:ChaN family lipoprotein [Burkholderiales bacterium]